MIDNSGFNEVKPFDFRQIRKLPISIEKKLEEVNLRFVQNLILLFKTIVGESKEEILVSSQRAEMESSFVEKSGERFDFTLQIDSHQDGRLALDKNLASQLLCFYLGYPTGERVSQVKLTKIEKSALFQLVEGIVKELQNAWAKDLSIGKLSSGYRKGLEDGLVVSRFLVKFGMTSGEIEISYPFSVLDKVCTGDLSSSMESKQKIKELIENSEAELTCVLGKVGAYCNTSLQLTLSQVAELKPGNVILMDREGDSEVIIFIREKKSFRGIPGIYNGRKGVKIVSTFS